MSVLQSWADEYRIDQIEEECSPARYLRGRVEIAEDSMLREAPRR